jgi:predicted RNA binding protein YcfA (HicA-like mRNA interferase family)
MPGSLYRELTSILKDAGWHFVRQAKGSHEFWYSPVAKRMFSIPSNISSRRLANDILRQAGLPKAF